MFIIILNAYFHSYTNNIGILSINTSIFQHLNKQKNRTSIKTFNGSILIGKTLAEQMVFSGVRQTLVSAGGIVFAMRTIPPIAKKVRV